MPLILDKIVKNKIEELENLKSKVPLKVLKEKAEEMERKGLSFKRAITCLKEENLPVLIAEIKKASPTLGLLATRFNPLDLASIYEKNGARALSVVTDKEFFQGDIEILRNISKLSSIPILRKDFIIDEYQIYESAEAGANAVLLIASIISKEKILKFLGLSDSLGLDCLVEIHTDDDLDKVLATKAEIIAINNRNLYTFEVDLRTTLRLKLQVPEGRIVVSESGIKNREDALLLREKGISAILVGEALIRSKDIEKKVREFTGE